LLTQIKACCSNSEPIIVFGTINHYTEIFFKKYFGTYILKIWKYYSN